jgi:hypothetical protein
LVEGANDMLRITKRLQKIFFNNPMSLLMDADYGDDEA